MAYRTFVIPINEHFIMTDIKMLIIYQFALVFGVVLRILDMLIIFSEYRCLKR
jgi:hypothetical protein